MSDPITTPEALVSTWVRLTHERSCGVPLSCGDERGCEGLPGRIETAALRDVALTVLFRPDAPTPTPAACQCASLPWRHFWGPRPTPHPDCPAHGRTLAGDDRPEAIDTRGLHDKFRIERTDGRSAYGQKHHGCRYFVLDLDHDEDASAAVASYADAVRNTRPELAADLDRAWPAARPSAPTVTTEQVFAEIRRHGYEAGRPSVERCRCGQVFPWIGDATETMDRHRAEQIASLMSNR